jgi:histidinol-phosphate aminotransferase
MIDIGKEQTADKVFDNLLRQGVIVRSLSAYGYPQYIRVTVGKHEENIRFLEALEKVI